MSDNTFDTTDRPERSAPARDARQRTTFLQRHGLTMLAVATLIIAVLLLSLLAVDVEVYARASVVEGA